MAKQFFFFRVDKAGTRWKHIYTSYLKALNRLKWWSGLGSTDMISTRVQEELANPGMVHSRIIEETTLTLAVLDDDHG